MKILTLPNILSLSRIPLVILFILAFPDIYLALIIFLIYGLTDVLDGYFARKYKQHKNIGIFIDVLADRISAITVVLFLFFYYELELWKFILLGFKDFILVLFGLPLIFKNGYLNLNKPKFFGKKATFFQFITIILIIIQNSLQNLFIFITFIFGFIALVGYGRERSWKLF